jgi:hypothetical protein
MSARRKLLAIGVPVVGLAIGACSSEHGIAGSIVQPYDGGEDACAADAAQLGRVACTPDGGDDANDDADAHVIVGVAPNPPDADAGGEG